MPTLAWLAAHLPLLSTAVAIVVALGGMWAQLAARRASRAAARKAELDIAAIPAAAWEHAAAAYKAELDLVGERLDALEPIAERVPALEDKVARLERENLTLRLAGGKERKTIARLKARVAQLVQVIQDMGGTVPPEPTDPPQP